MTTEEQQDLRKEVIAECARANCQHCADGKKVAFEEYLGVWAHPDKPCNSYRLWELRNGNPKHGELMAVKTPRKVRA